MGEHYVNPNTKKWSKTKDREMHKIIMNYINETDSLLTKPNLKLSLKDRDKDGKNLPKGNRR